MMKYLIILSIILAMLFTSRGLLRVGDSYNANEGRAAKIQRMLMKKLFNDDRAESQVSSVVTYFLCILLFSSQELP